MKFHSKLACGLGVLAFGILGSTQLKADAVYTGTLTDPSMVVQENLSLSSAGDVSIYTTSYGGGKNLDGTTTAAGGFQPNITLYNSDGTYVASQGVNPGPMANADPKTGWTADGYLMQSDLTAGNYIVTLTNWDTQQPVTATNLSDGFVAGSTNFNDPQGNARTGAYALDISAASGPVSATPEPATFWLMLPGLAGAAFLMRKRSASVS